MNVSETLLPLGVAEALNLRHAPDPQFVLSARVGLSLSERGHFHPFPPLRFFLLLLIPGPRVPLTIATSFGDSFVQIVFSGQRWLG